MGRTHCRGRRSRPKGDPALEGRDGRERRTDLLRRQARGLLAAGLAILGLGTLAPAAGAVEEEAVTFPGGPLTVSIGPLGQCQSSYPAHGNNFYPGSGTLGDCGFFLAFPAANNIKALEGQTYGFNGAAFGGYGSQPGLDLCEEADRSAVTGSGTVADPYM